MLAAPVDSNAVTLAQSNLNAANETLAAAIAIRNSANEAFVQAVIESLKANRTYLSLLMR